MPRSDWLTGSVSNGGILQCDGYQGYEKIGAPGIVRAGCLAHGRRKFADALKLDP
ncbi:MAG: transposase, partial [Terrimicrobiaceae bacterium]